jgi:hypothetical protein
VKPEDLTAVNITITAFWDVIPLWSVCSLILQMFEQPLVPEMQNTDMCAWNAMKINCE